MGPLNRRTFLGGALATGTALAASGLTSSEAAAAPHTAHSAHKAAPEAGDAAIDFRYSPVEYQTAFCFPDDPCKSLVNEAGHLLYGFDNWGGIHYFPLKIGFALRGMRPPKVLGQRLESPAVPIVHTTLGYPGAEVRLTTFATNRAGEGRVDNVIFEVVAHGDEPLDFEPLVVVDAVDAVDLEEKSGTLAVLDRATKKVLLVGRPLAEAPTGADAGTMRLDIDRPWRLTLHRGRATKASPYRAFFRLPQTGQDAAAVAAGLAEADACLQSCRDFWAGWQAYRAPVTFALPGREGEFATACARNILQAREVRDGKLTFQVGPTCYRGLWVVDGNFILEAARYMGLDKEAMEGLRTTWSGQLPTGQVLGGGGKEHWKDTAIALFTLVRQCELSQDWRLLRELEPQVAHALEFLRSLQALAVNEGSAMGRYGLLAKGFADGGIGGVRDEFTNTLWALAGLKALAEAAAAQQMASLSDAGRLFSELSAAFQKASAQEMRRYASGFDYLPMVLKDDPDWQLPDPWDRPRPQSAQWALSQAIFPGRVFAPEDPVVRGHVKLMQAVTREGIPSETGWSHHNSVWNYNAAFVAEVYLWLGMRQAAHDTFVGFLNHASPQYCWREEQPLQDSLVLTYVGDMPHNWASAECIRFLRHMYALEDGTHLRLLAGVTEAELAPVKPISIGGTPTRFGRVSLELEPLDRDQGWRMSYERGPGPAPEKLWLPVHLNGRFSFTAVDGAPYRMENGMVAVDPDVPEWCAFWRAAGTAQA